MKGIKGGILKKLKSIPQVGYLKQGRVLYLNASDGLPDSPPPRRDPNRPLCDLPICSDDQNRRLPNPPTSPQPEIIDVSELMKDLEDEDDTELSDDNKENIRPAPWNNNKKKKESTENQKGEVEASPFRRPDLNSETLFDPDLLAAFERAVMDHIRSYEEARTKAMAFKEEDPHRDEEPPYKVPRIEVDDDDDPLMEFEQRCPPGGGGLVVLYTTSLRGIRKTFEDCNGVRYLLESSKVVFHERDVSMHLEFREELWRVLGRRAIPPRLFIKGRYIGGADEVLGLHEQGRLMQLLQGMPLDQTGGALCERCSGVRFLVCGDCSGSRKLYGDGQEVPIQCHSCNENGLVLCPIFC